MFDTIITIIVFSFVTFKPFDIWMRSFAADLCNEMHIMSIASYNILTLISSCKKHFCLPFNKATLLLTLPFSVMSRMFSFLEGRGRGA